MLRYIYNSYYDYVYDYDQYACNVGLSTFNVRMFALGEKYFVRELCTRAARKFGEVVEEDLSTTNDLAIAFTEAFETTSDVDNILRAAMVDAAVITALRLCTSHPESCAIFWKRMNQVPGFGALIAQSLVTDTLLDKDGSGLYECPKREYKGCENYSWSYTTADDMDHTHHVLYSVCPYHHVDNDYGGWRDLRRHFEEVDEMDAFWLGLECVEPYLRT